MMLLRVLLSHYRRHPVQAAFLLTSIIMANVLLVGTQLINAQARASYARGESLLNAGPIGELQARNDDRPIDETDYIRLRRQGFEMLVPVLGKVIRTASGEPVELVAIDALVMPRSSPGTDNKPVDWANSAGFSFPPYQVWASAARLRQLGWQTGDVIRTRSGQALPPLHAVHGGGLGHRLLVDIGVLQALTNSAGQLSSVLVFPTHPERLSALTAALPNPLRYVANEAAVDPAELTRSFHLNLAAMGLLAFVVGIFLIYNALAFSFTDRHELLRKLRLAGVTRAQLRRALLFELGLFLGLGSLLGGWLGGQLAVLLLPGVGQTLAQLYGVYIAYPDGLSPGGYWLPLLMTAGAGGLCALQPMRQSLNAPLLERWSSGWQRQVVARRDKWLLVTGIGLLTLSWLLAVLAGNVWTALTGMAFLLLGAALCLPASLRWILAGLGRLVPARRPRLAWLIADSRWLLGPASLALMAMMLALVANSGLNTMIFSFRQATDDWLQQRLAAQLYLRAQVDSAKLSAWIAEQAPGAFLAERYRAEIERPSPASQLARVEIVTLQKNTHFLDTAGLIRAADHARVRFDQGKGVFISERAWRLDGWKPGDRLRLCDAQPDAEVLGIYHDYGNPRSQWMLSESLFKDCWPQLAPAGLSLLGDASLDWPGLRARMLDEFDLEESALISQVELKAVGMAVFDRTFQVTNALNLLTLLVAGIGIFCAVSAIHYHRVVQQALLAALGLTRRERGALLILQWGLLGLLCMVLVWPFGTLLAAYLAGVVTPVAFGWSFALQLEWSHYVVLALLAAGCLVMAVILPSMRLLGTSPAAMLREETT
jgi:putative ABC transport system permease protein